MGVVKACLKKSEGLRGRVPQFLRQGDSAFQTIEGLIRKASIPKRMCQIAMQGHTGIVSDLVDHLLFRTWIVIAKPRLQMASGFIKPSHMDQSGSSGAVAYIRRHTGIFFFCKTQ